VTGIGDNLFKGEHFQVGEYTLVVTPEPAGAALLGLGGLMAGLLLARRRARVSRRVLR